MRVLHVRPRDQRALLWGIVILLPVLAGRLVVLPAVRALKTALDAATMERATLLHERALVAGRGQMDHRQQQALAWVDRENHRLFSGHDDLAATGAFSRYVEHAAGETGAVLEHGETQTAVPLIGALRVLRLHVQAEGTSESIMEFLDALENGNRLVRIGRLAITKNDRPKTPLLDMDADLYAYTFSSEDPGARSLTTMPEQGGSYQPPSAFLGVPASMVSSWPDIGDAVDNDPFSPDRGHGTPAAPATHPATPPPIQLVGTAVDSATGNSFAICQFGTNPPTVVHLGERFAGYDMRAISRNGIIVRDPSGHDLRLTLPSPRA